MAMPMPEWRRPPNSGDYGFHNRVMLSAALSLSAVVILVICLHLYFRYTHARRSAGRNTIGLFRPGAVDDPASEPPSTGLHPSVISSLPTTPYKKLLPANAAEEGASPAVECAVCLSALEEGEVIRLLPNCGHLFHVGCIDAWLATRSNCPVCRAKAEPKPADVPTEPAPLPPQQPGPAEVAAAAPAAEGTSGPCKDQEVGAASRLNASMLRMLSLGRSQRRAQADHVAEDLERQ